MAGDDLSKYGIPWDYVFQVSFPFDQEILNIKFLLS